MSLLNDDNARLSRNHLETMQMNRFKIFTEQDLEKGRFDITFEIEGKLLYAHAFILTSVSETLDSWLTDRWTKKNEIIKIETYSYENFYQFLCFMYIARCDFGFDNVFGLTDMAEFYAVPFLKESCDKFLSSMKYAVENVEEMYDFAEKYSLPLFAKAIKHYITANCLRIGKCDKFLGFKKSFAQLFATNVNAKCREEVFEAIYNWGEHEVMKRNFAKNENFDLQDAVKIEVGSILPTIDFSKMSFEFLMNFVLEKGFLLPPVQFEWLLLQNHYNDFSNRLKIVCELAEKQALQKQKMSFDADNFNLATSMKSDLANVFPYVPFYKVDKKFVMDFLVAKGIFSDEEANKFYHTRVEIINGKKLFTGDFIDEHGIRFAFEKLNRDHRFLTRPGTKNKLRFYDLKFSRPTTPSTAMKMVGCEWYLCLEQDRSLAVTHYSSIQRNDYLLAQMTSSDNYQIDPSVGAQITFSNNV